LKEIEEDGGKSSNKKGEPLSASSEQVNVDRLLSEVRKTQGFFIQVFEK